MVQSIISFILKFGSFTAGLRDVYLNFKDKTIIFSGLSFAKVQKMKK